MAHRGTPEEQGQFEHLLDKGLWLALQHSKALARENRPLAEADICKLHKLAFQQAWPGIAGEYRGVDIDAFEPIADLPPHHSLVPGEMLSFGRELEKRTGEGPGDAPEAVRLAIWAHMETVRIHPFQDGNGKTARFLMDAILMRYVTGPPRNLVIPPDTKERYMDCVQHARQGRSEPFEALIADLLDAMVRQEERRIAALVRLMERKRAKRGKAGV